jgi:hypothetical protein
VERVLTALRLRKTQDKCQSLRDRGALEATGGVADASATHEVDESGDVAVTALDDI